MSNWFIAEHHIDTGEHSLKPEEVRIDGEFIILFEDYAGGENIAQERFDQLSGKISELAAEYGFRCKGIGTEQQMRLSLVDRAKFIAEHHIDTGEQK